MFVVAEFALLQQPFQNLQDALKETKGMGKDEDGERQLNETGQDKGRRMQQAMSCAHSQGNH